MTSFSIMYFMLGLASLFLLILTIMLLHPKWRKGLFQAYPETARRSKLAHLADGLELLIYPIIWLFKIIAAIFK
ncbi:hypothetical protein GHJ48_07665 [Acinetobacter sp. dk771]|uniref:Uncharacterized protein n=1 Tax=Acinetobacter wanghuae TaxID=2662362 RepID=A0AA90WC00_9GAMM|nr:hypothetical protein [Acinetobacter wanghuae]MQW92268.1 hypothetical protein [Acinetobacter wanghuae]